MGDDTSRDPREELGLTEAAPLKDPKGSARAKYNRRKISLAHAMQQMEMAITKLEAQPGPLYKRAEVDALKAAIAEFREQTRVSIVESAIAPEQMDRIMDVLMNGKEWVPPSVEVMDEVRLALGMAKAEGTGTEDDLD